MTDRRQRAEPGERAEAVYDLLRYVRPLVLNSARVVQRTADRLDLTVGGRAVLELFVEQGEMTVPEAARLLDLPRQNVQRLVAQLRDRSLLTRRDNPGHKRSHLIRATSEGRRLFGQLRAGESEHLAALALDVTDEQIEVARYVLHALDRDVRALARSEDGDDH